MENVLAFLVSMFVVVVFGLFSIFAIKNMYTSQYSFLQEEAVLAFRQLLENPGNYTKSPPTIGIATKDLPYTVNLTALSILKNMKYANWKGGLVSSEDDVRIILYNGTRYLILGANITRSRVAAVNGYAFCPPSRCLGSSFCCPSSGNITVKVVVTGD